jgi:succinoglycan biosynthesis transport protein ExoP
MTTESNDPEDMRMDLGAMFGAVLARWLRIVVVTLLLLAATFVVLMFMPRMYESSASILVETRDNAFTGPASSTGTSSGGGTSISADSAISSQIELIKSRDTLLTVVDSLNLRSEPEFNGGGANPLGMVLQIFGRKPQVTSIDDAVLQNLNERLTVIRERDSAIISIYVRSQNPQLAASIANAIAAAHVQRRADQSLADTAEASTWLEQEIVKLRQRVTEAETKVANFRSQNDLFDGTNNTSLLDQQLSDIATQITAAQERKSAAQSRATLIRGLIDAGQPIDGIADVQGSVVIQQLSQSKADLQGQLAQKSSTLLGNHPTIRALNAQINEIEQQIAEEGRRVAASLEAEAKIEADLEASLQDQLTRMKLSATSAATSTVTLDELQREAKAQRDLLESYLLRYRDAVSRSDSSSALPDVRVVTLAAPSDTPASPKTGLILGAVAFVALALQIGATMFGELMSGRAVVARPPRYVEPELDLIEPEEPELLFAESAESDEEVVDSETIEAEPAVAASGPEPMSADAIEETALAEDEEIFEHRPSDMPTLSADIALGRVRIVMLAGLSGQDDYAAVSDTLVSNALRSGLSIVRVDAGSGHMSIEPGITDLAAELVSFGDVVHKGARDGLAEVPWGHQTALDRRSRKPGTLVEALTDIYEVVLVLTGRVGMASSLPVFAGTDCRLALVTQGEADPDQVEAAFADFAALGYAQAQTIMAPMQHAAVA